MLPLTVWQSDGKLVRSRLLELKLSTAASLTLCLLLCVSLDQNALYMTVRIPGMVGSTRQSLRVAVFQVDADDCIGTVPEMVSAKPDIHVWSGTTIRHITKVESKGVKGVMAWEY